MSLPGQRAHPLGELGQDIRRLEAIVQAGERDRRARDRSRGTVDHLLLQIRRLRTKLRDLQRRASSESEDAKQERIRILQSKIVKLQGARANTPGQQARQVRSGAHAMLHVRLLQAIHRLREDPNASRKLLMRYRRLAADLVRRRRERSTIVSATMERARDKLIVLARLLEDEEVAGEALEDRLFELLGAANRDFSEGIDRLDQLALEWPEFRHPLHAAQQQEEPLEELLFMLRESGVEGLSRNAIVRGAREASLWVNRLAQSLRNVAPPPLRVS